MIDLLSIRCVMQVALLDVITPNLEFKEKEITISIHLLLNKKKKSVELLQLNVIPEPLLFPKEAIGVYSRLEKYNEC